MASIISGYEYDIFISYRQKDNKGDRWVSDFVEALKTELESTLKDEISVYFDINPHDGLLETHDVSASLKEKLKCMLFIPVISHTYCDPRSFAWQYEFVAFNKIAKEDQFGRDIRLAGGNVASRILPVKIHDLDAEDKELLENELGGVLRCIEFIYKTPGVNRPLRTNEDHPQDNLNKTYYRDQINKVANAVKEIVTAMKKSVQKEASVTNEVLTAKPVLKKNLKTKILAGSLILLALMVLGYFIIPKVSQQTDPEVTTIAILPFENLSNDKDNDWMGAKIRSNIFMQLNDIEGLSSRNVPPGFKSIDTTKTISETGKQLYVDYWITGSVQRDSTRISVKACLNNTKTNTQLIIEPVEGDYTDFENLQIRITVQIADKLKRALTSVEKTRIEKKMTDEPLAYEIYSRTLTSLMKNPSSEGYFKAVKEYEKALALDPKFCLAWMELGNCHLNLYASNIDRTDERRAKGKIAIDSALNCDKEVAEMPAYHIAQARLFYLGFQNIPEALKEIGIAEKKSNNKYYNPLLKATIYQQLGEWKLCKENYLKELEQNPNNWAPTYFVGRILYILGEYREAEKYFKSAINISPTIPFPYWQRINMDMKWNGNTIRGRETIAEAFQFKELINNPVLVESKVLMDIYDGNYESALSFLSSKNINAIAPGEYYNLKSLLYARIYDLMNIPDKATAYYDSARIAIEPLSLKNPDDSRFHSALGIAYAGLGQKGKAIEEGAKAVDLTPFDKYAYLGVFRIQDLARIYVMIGDYDKALDRIKFLLAHPGPLSVKMLQLDPVWKPLREMPEFKKIIRRAPADDSRI
jgi:tetratricopeptide (TPR) repeat protein